MTIETANRLIALRKEAGYSQEALAGKLNISRQAISKWERSEASPDTENLIELSKLYGISLDELLMGTKQAKSEQHEKDSSAETGQKSGNDNPHVSFKNGIHVVDGDGSEVHVGFGGIHVNDKKTGEKVDVSLGGIYVENFAKGENINISGKGINDRGLFPMLVVTAYFFLGCFWELWSSAWLLFFLVPIYYSAIKAIKEKRAEFFAYPVLAALVYLCLGLFWGLWGGTVFIFLTIPLYYIIFTKKKVKDNKEWKCENGNWKYSENREESETESDL